MEFIIGDIVSGKGIQYGRLSGYETISDVAYYKIDDLTKKATYFIPTIDSVSLRKLPSKKDVFERLKIFKKRAQIDVGEIDGSRYKFFKTKLEVVDFQKSLEVLHDLASLKLGGTLNSSEKKLHADLKEKIGAEISYVLEKSTDEIYPMIDFS